MQSTDTIQYLQNNQIDKKKWDESIHSSVNGLIYGFSFYLDNVCKGWGAIAAKDYSWIMPLGSNKKYGIPYLFQPAFTQQLGIFFQSNTIVPLAEIIQFLQNQFSFFDINWNHATNYEKFPETLQTNASTNLIIDLAKGYDRIYASYHKDLIKNLKRSKQFSLLYEVTEDIGLCIEQYKNHYQKRMPHLNKKDFDNLYALCKHAQQNNQTICRKVMNEKGELLSIVLMLKDDKRIYNLLNTTTVIGRKYEANHFLLDAVIQEFSSSHLLFDFEGSDLPGVKTFYENFGAVNQPYFNTRYNNLVWPLKYFKK